MKEQGRGGERNGERERETHIGIELAKRSSRSVEMLGKH